MNGKTVLITGGNSGLGLETVRDLAKRAAHIIMASRKTEVGNKVRGFFTFIVTPSIEYFLTVSLELQTK